jgi:hypothetical protein
MNRDIFVLIYELKYYIYETNIGRMYRNKRDLITSNHQYIT